MLKLKTNLAATLAVALAVAVGGAGSALASNGADDPPGHHQGEHHHHQGEHHHHRGHHHRGNDGPNHK